MTESYMDQKPISRRSLLKGSAALLAGGLAGGLGTAACSRREGSAPPLPWKWVELDPMEAGRRAFNFYLEKKG